jgi:CheY-like chemotaxis protein
MVRRDSPSVPEAPRPAVLLAEPDRLRGALITAGLDDLGVHVAWAADGDTALELAEQLPFDVHVVDPSVRARNRERVVESLVTQYPCVPVVHTGSSAAAVHLASTQLSVAEVVELVRAALERRHGLHPPGPQQGASGARTSLI